jgi:hypothetical protein
MNPSNLILPGNFSPISETDKMDSMAQLIQIPTIEKQHGQF